MVNSKNFTHSMTDLCAALDAKIAALEQAQETVAARLKEGISPQKNTVALQQLTNSLAHVREARYASESSCCGYTCNIDYDE